jgi:hypothetical protein
MGDSLCTTFSSWPLSATSTSRSLLALSPCPPFRLRPPCSEGHGFWSTQSASPCSPADAVAVVIAFSSVQQRAQTHPIHQRRATHSMVSACPIKNGTDCGAEHLTTVSFASDVGGGGGGGCGGNTDHESTVLAEELTAERDVVKVG